MRTSDSDGCVFARRIFDLTSHNMPTSFFFKGTKIYLVMYMVYYYFLYDKLVPVVEKLDIWEQQ
jgi:hypothetical protein